MPPPSFLPSFLFLYHLLSLTTTLFLPFYSFPTIFSSFVHFTPVLPPPPPSLPPLPSFLHPHFTFSLYCLCLLACPASFHSLTPLLCLFMAIIYYISHCISLIRGLIPLSSPPVPLVFHRESERERERSEGKGGKDGRMEGRSEGGRDEGRRRFSFSPPLALHSFPHPGTAARRLPATTALQINFIFHVVGSNVARPIDMTKP